MTSLTKTKRTRTLCWQSSPALSRAVSTSFHQYRVTHVFCGTQFKSVVLQLKQLGCGVRVWYGVRIPPFCAVERSSNLLCYNLSNQVVERGFDAGFEPRRSTLMTPRWWVWFPCSCYQWWSGYGSLEHYVASTVDADAVIYLYRLIVSFVCCGFSETRFFQNFPNNTDML